MNQCFCPQGNDFISFERLMIAFLNVLLIKGPWFVLIYLYFKRMCLFTKNIIISSNLSYVILFISWKRAINSTLLEIIH